MKDVDSSLVQIYIQADWDRALKGLGLDPKKKGDYFEIKCPRCHERRAFFYPNVTNGSPQIVCNRRNGCGFDQHLLEHINGGSFPTGESWKKAVKKLADLAGVVFDLNDNVYKPKKRRVLDAYWEFLQKRFLCSEAEKYVREDRGLNASAMFGYIPSVVDELKNWALEEGFSDADLISAGILKESGNRMFVSMAGRLAGAFIDQKGVVHNIWGRKISDFDESPKYLNLANSSDAHKKSPYGAEWVKNDTVVWVEGYLDVIVLKNLGIGAVAAGSCSVTQEMLEALPNVKKIVLALDADSAGYAGAFRFIEKNINAEALKIFSINHSLLDGCKDIAELYQKKGADPVKNLFLAKNLQHAFSFVAKRIVSESKGEEEWTAVSKEEAFDRAEKFCEKVVSPSKVTLLDEFFWEKGIQPALGMSSETLMVYRENLSKARNDREFSRAISVCLQEAAEKVKNGDFQGLTKIISKTSSFCASKSKDFKEAPIEFICDLDENWLSEAPREKDVLLYHHQEENSGYCGTQKSKEQKKDLKKEAFLPRGIVGMVAGPGGVGKSHLLAQIAVTVSSGFPLLKKFHPKNIGNVFLGMAENTLDDIRRLIWGSIKELSQEQRNNMQKRLAPFPFLSQSSAFIEEGKPSAYYYWLKEQLIKKAPEGGWDLIIFDPASRFFGIEAEKDNALATLFIKILEELAEDLPGCPTVLFAHHVNKGSINQKEQRNQSAARGASGLTDGCRWQLNLFKKEDKEGQLELELVKTNFTASIKPMALKKGVYGELKTIE